MAKNKKFRGHTVPTLKKSEINPNGAIGKFIAAIEKRNNTQQSTTVVSE